MGDKIFHTHPDRPWGPPSLQSHPRSLSQGVKHMWCSIDHPPHLVPRLTKEQSYTSSPLLGLNGLFWGELYISPPTTAKFRKEWSYTFTLTIH